MPGATTQEHDSVGDPRGRAGRTTPRRRLTLVAAALAALGVLGACAPPPPGFAPGTASRVIVYGDSLVSESRVEIARRLDRELDGWDVVFRHLGGTAQCDWHAHMHADAALRPAVVVLAFSGNRLSPCTRRAYPQLYAQDATWATSFWRAHGARVAFVGAPPPVGASTTQVPEAYRSVATRLKVPFESAERLFIDPTTGRATMTLPCLPAEASRAACVNGAITVRNPDGAHLCPAPDVLLGCRGYASGVTRYADVVVAAAGRAASIATTRLPAPQAPPTTAPPTTAPPTTAPPTTAPPGPEGPADDGGTDVS